MPAPLTQTTGRRKQAVARVRFRPGQGAIRVNKQPIEAYFTSATHRMLLTEPLRVTNTTESYDIDATIDGGRHLGPGRRHAPGHRPQPVRDGPRAPRRAEALRPPDPRRP